MDSSIDFASLFDLQELQTIQDAFAEAMGVASLITRPDGSPLTRPSNFRRFCNDIVRATPLGSRNCIKSDALFGAPDPTGPIVRPCLSSGLWDAGASITVGGHHLANWLMGQVRDESQDEESLLRYADTIGADRVQYRQALSEVPVMSRERFHKIAHALFVLANQISKHAYLIFIQKRMLKETFQAREKLRQSEETFRTINDSINEFLFVHDTENWNILYVNKRACDHYGYTRQEMVRLRISHLSSGIPPYDQPHAEAYLRKALAGMPQCFEWQGKTRDARLFWLEISIRLARIGDADRLLVTARDITDRKAAQEEMLQERAFTDAIMNSVPGLLYLYDDHGRLIRWNKKHEELTGYSSEELSRMTLADWYAGDADELNKIKKAVSNIFTTGYVEEEGNLRNKDGSRRLYLMNGVPLALEGKNYFAGIGIDISERKRLHDLMIQTEKMMSIGGLAAGMAHEINNPLSGILQNAQVLLRRLSADLPANDSVARSLGCSFKTIAAFMKKRDVLTLLESIHSAGKRAAYIVASMLEFSRMGNPQFSEANINTLLDKSLSLCATDFDLKKNYDFKSIAVSRRFEPDLPLVSCVETQLQQVFMNILGNAAQAMYNQCDPTIVLRTRKHAESVLIEIQDNGPGMSEEVRKHVFDPFFTTKPVGEGTGLGLSVSYFIIVKHHHGSLEVQSSPGRGAVFRIELPVRHTQRDAC